MAKDDPRDRELQARAVTLQTFAGDLVDWTREYNPRRLEVNLKPLDPLGEFRLLRLRQRTADLVASSHLPAAAAVYGPSQVGKSLFIGRVLQPVDTGRSPLGLDANLGPPSYYPGLSFTDDLNPKGGNNEATALVTRFTTKDRLGTNTADTPVLVRALTRRDWLKVLGRGTLDVGADVATTRWDEETLRKRLAGLPAGNSDDPDWLLDLVDAYDYLHSLDAKTFVAAPEIFYRVLAARPVDPVRVAEAIFWEPYRELTALFLEVSEIIKKIRQGGKDALLIPWAGVRFLLDTQRNKFYTDSPTLCPESRPVNLHDFHAENRGGWHVLAHRPGSTQGISQKDLAMYQAALLEMVLPVLPENLHDDWRQVLAEVDLLDIPGARAEGTLASAKDFSQQMEIVKRGKVNFLFDHYAGTLQIQTLLLLAKLGNCEALKPLKRGLDRWGRSRYGNAWTAHVSGEPALLVGLTGIDDGFYKQSQPSPSLFDSSLHELVLAFGPVLTDFGGKGVKFRSVYPLRYPGTMDQNAEKQQQAGPQKWVQAGQVWNTSRLILEHVQDHETRWQAALHEEDGGLSLLSGAFRKGTNKQLKQDQLQRTLDETLRALHELFNGMAPTGEINIRREQRLVLARQTLGSLAEDPTLAYYRAHALLSVLSFEKEDVYPLADLSESLGEGAKGGAVRAESLEQRLRQTLTVTLASWAGKVPQRWRDHIQRHPQAADTGFDIADLARGIQDYLAVTEVFESLVKALLPVVELRTKDENAGRQARRKYTRILLDDYATNPGPNRNPLADAVPFDGKGQGLMLPFLARWHARLTGALTLGAGQAVQIPPGNDALRALLAKYPNSGVAHA